MRRIAGTGFDSITEPQRAFAVEWVRSRSPKKALEAGKFSVAGNVTRRARVMLRRVEEYVQTLEQSAERSAMLSIGNIQKHLANLAYANPLDYLIVDPITKRTRPKQLGELTREEAAGLAEYELYAMKDQASANPEDVIWVVTNIKLHNQTKALEALAKIQGYGLAGKVPAGTGTTPVDSAMLENLPTKDLVELERILRQGANMLSTARDRAAIPAQSSPGGSDTQIPQGTKALPAPSEAAPRHT